MELKDHYDSLEVFYDGRCAMCCTFQEWVAKQPRAFPVKFIPYQADEATDVFPEIKELDPAREMIVRTGEGEVFRGEEGWVLTLFSCENHQDNARRLASPVLLPMAKQACKLVAANRLTISKLFFRKKDKEVKENLHQMEREQRDDDCDSGFCKLD